MFVSSTIDVDKISKYSFDVTISFIHIPCFHYVTTYFDMSKDIIETETTSRFDWSRISNHK